MTTEDRTFRTLLRDLVDEVQRLFRQELQLARAETAEKVNQVQNGAISIIAGLLLAFSALLILLQALVVALAEIMEPWLASVIVGVAVAVLALILVKAGQSTISATNLTPERTLQSVREDKDMLMEKAK